VNPSISGAERRGRRLRLNIRDETTFSIC